MDIKNSCSESTKSGIMEVLVLFSFIPALLLLQITSFMKHYSWKCKKNIISNNLGLGIE